MVVALYEFIVGELLLSIIRRLSISIILRCRVGLSARCVHIIIIVSVFVIHPSAMIS